MRYLVILKDSFREAIDSKVLYVLLGLSVVLILLVVTTSFQPMEMEEELKSFTGELNWHLGNRLQRKRDFAKQPGEDEMWGLIKDLRFGFKDFQQTDAEKVPWLRDYRFTITLQAPPEGIAGFVTPQVMRTILEVNFGLIKQLNFKNLQVTRSQAADGKEVYFQVTTGGTKVTTRRGWPHFMWLFGAVRIPVALPLGFEVYIVEGAIVNGLGGWITLIVAVVITGFFVPNMLRKGTVDLLLVKPIHRWSLLIMKYIGGLSFMFLSTTFTIGGVWLALGLRTGVWDAGFLLTIFTLTFFFAILYAISTLFAVLTRSTIVAIMMTLALWFLFFLVGMIYQWVHSVHEPESIPGWVYATVDTVHYVLPRTSDLGALTSRLLITQALPEDLSPELREAMDRVSFNWGETLGVSFAFIVLTLGLSCWRFSAKDF